MNITEAIELLENLILVEKDIMIKNYALKVLNMLSSGIYKGCSYRVLDNTLYIKIRSVLVGGLGKPSEISINGDFKNINQVIIEDETSQKVIWTK